MITALNIYEAYPRKIGRRKALLEIERAVRRLQNGECGQKLTYKEATAGLLKATKVNGESKDAALARKNGDVLDRMREKEGAARESGTLIFERADRRIDSPVGQHPRKLFG